MPQAANEIPKLNALILIGGKSKRMGSDKSILDYHGKPQWQHLVDLLKKHIDTVYISVRPNQLFDYPYLITDKEADLGPFGAILTALETKSKEAFLVIATDIPFINEEIIKKLIADRDVSKAATAFKATEKDYPEPLITIWEPKSLTTLQAFYTKGVYKPIQVLKFLPIKTIPVSMDVIQNINTEQDYKKVIKQLKEK